jgi:hypothetical protein
MTRILLPQFTSLEDQDRFLDELTWEADERRRAKPLYQICKYCGQAVNNSTYLDTEKANV